MCGGYIDTYVRDGCQERASESGKGMEAFQINDLCEGSTENLNLG